MFADDRSSFAWCLDLVFVNLKALSFVVTPLGGNVVPPTGKDTITVMVGSENPEKMRIFNTKIGPVP